MTIYLIKLDNVLGLNLVLKSQELNIELEFKLDVELKLRMTIELSQVQVFGISDKLKLKLYS